MHTPFRPLAYADDLLTSALSLPHLQRQADIIHAFAAIFGLQLAPTKTQTFRIHYADHKPSAHDHLILYGPNWTPQTYPIRSIRAHKRGAPSFTYLGIPFDFNLSGKAQLQHLRRRLHQAVTLVLRSRASLATKQRVIESHLHGLLNYFGPFLTVPLHTYDTQLRPILDQAWRTLTKNTLSFPTALLHLPPTHGGLGLKDISATAQAAKLNQAIRLSHRDPYAVAVIASLTLRTPSPNNTSHHWNSSLNQHLASLGLHPVITGTTPLSDPPSLRPHPDLVHYTPTYDPPLRTHTTPHHTAQPGDFFSSADDSIYELTHVLTDNTLRLREWHRLPYTLNEIRPSSHYHPSTPLTLPHLTGLIHTRPSSSIPAPTQPRTQHIQAYTPTPVLPPIPPQRPLPDWITYLTRTLDPHRHYTLSVDASWISDPPTPRHALFPRPTDPPHTKGTTSVLIIPTNILPTDHLIILRITDNSHQASSAYGLELLGLCLAVQISHHLPGRFDTILTDCKPAYQALQSYLHRGSPKTHHYHQILQICHPYRHLLCPPITWTASHPERRTRDQSKWTHHQLLNYITDYTTNHTTDDLFEHWPAPLQIPATRTDLSITLQEALKQTSPPHLLMLTSANRTPPTPWHP